MLDHARVFHDFEQVKKKKKVFLCYKHASRCDHHLRNSYFERGSRLIGTPKPSTCSYRQVLISARHLPLELWRSYSTASPEPMCTVQVDNNLDREFKMDIMPGGSTCAMQYMPRESPPFLGPNLYIPPPGRCKTLCRADQK